MATSGQTFNDRINAARYALAGQGLARCVCKATTEEVIGPKKKHLDYLIACTHEPNVSIPQLANLLIERTNHIYWVVVFKALVTVHHLMSYGNERFFQYIASSNYSFELSTFLDKTNARDFTMSTYIRRYSRYINEKALSYRLLAFDFCKVKRGNEGVLRVMPIERLLKTLPILQNQLDSLLEFDCSANDLNNGVINACFMLLFRDLIGLFACHSDGIINLLNRYFSLNKRMCREAFELYRKSLIRMDKVSEFLRVAETVGIEKDELPDLRKTPNSLIDALEQHLLNLESNKKILKQQNNNNSNQTTTHLSTTGGSQRGASELNVLGSLTPPSGHRPQSPSSSVNGQMQSTTDDFQVMGTFKDDEVKRALEEEARVLSQYGNESSSKKNKLSTSHSGSSSSSSNNNNHHHHHQQQSQNSAATKPKKFDDLFGDPNLFDALSNNNNQNGSSSNHNNSNNDNSVQQGFDALGLLNNSSTATSTTASTILNNNIGKQKHASSVDFEALKSAVNKLEKPSSGVQAAAKTAASGKASDDLFGLLTAPAGQDAASSQLGSKQQPATFVGSSPFDLPLGVGGEQAPAPALAANNPFPDLTSTKQGFVPPISMLNDPQDSLFSKTIAPVAPTPAVVTPSVARPATIMSETGQVKPNYTNLGGFEGYGVLLQPMQQTTGMTKTVGNNNNTFSVASATAAAGSTSAPAANHKRAFDAPSGLLIRGDLDATLANLAQNLTFESKKGSGNNK